MNHLKRSLLTIAAASLLLGAAASADDFQIKGHRGIRIVVEGLKPTARIELGGQYAFDLKVLASYNGGRLQTFQAPGGRRFAIRLETEQRLQRGILFFPDVRSSGPKNYVKVTRKGLVQTFDFIGNAQKLMLRIDDKHRAAVIYLDRSKWLVMDITPLSDGGRRLIPRAERTPAAPLRVLEPQLRPMGFMPMPARPVFGVIKQGPVRRALHTAAGRPRSLFFQHGDTRPVWALLDQ